MPPKRLYFLIVYIGFLYLYVLVNNNGVHEGRVVYNNLGV